MNNMELNQLIRDNAKKGDKICFDGIFDSEKYSNSKRRIVFLLKERNGENLGSDEVDLIKDIQQDFQKNKFPNMWLRLHDWSSIAVAEDFDWTYKKDNAKNLISDRNFEKGDLLRSVAILNLNKNFGGATVSENFSERVNAWAEVWKKQLKLLDPNLVVCCGTYYDVIGEFGYKNETDIEIDSGARVFYEKINKKEVPFLEFLHPGCRWSDRVLAAYFKECMKYL